MDCVALPPDRNENVCTLYAYDVAGRTVVTDTLGRITRSFYDGRDHVLGRIVN